MVCDMHRAQIKSKSRPQSPRNSTAGGIVQRGTSGEALVVMYRRQATLGSVSTTSAMSGTSSRNDIIARAVKSRILPTVKCPVITSDLPRSAGATLSPRSPEFPRRHRRRRSRPTGRDGRAGTGTTSAAASLATANGNASDTVLRLSILLARMTRLCPSSVLNSGIAASRDHYGLL